MREIYEYGNRALKWSKSLRDFADMIDFNELNKDENTISLTILEDEKDFVEEDKCIMDEDYLHRVTSFSINLSINLLKENGAMCLGKLIGRMENLVNLDLDVSSNQLGTSGV